MSKVQKAELMCEICGQKVGEVNHFIELPNNLVLELGEDI